MSANQRPAHKRNFDHYIASKRAHDERVDEALDAKIFQDLLNQCLERLPDDGGPADGYAYNAHMGSMVRALDVAKNEWINAQRAFYAARLSGLNVAETEKNQ